MDIDKYNKIKAEIDKRNPTVPGITGLPIPRPKTDKQMHKLEKRRRKNLGQNVGGRTYSSDVTPHFNPRSVREEVLVNYLLDEGFASDEKSAKVIASVMGEDWKESIFEAREEEGKSPEEKRKIRAKRYSERTGDTDDTPAFRGGPSMSDIRRRAEHREKDDKNKARAFMRGRRRGIGPSPYLSYLP